MIRKAPHFHPSHCPARHRGNGRSSAGDHTDDLPGPRRSFPSLKHLTPVLLLALIFLLASSPALAATRTVDSNADSGADTLRKAIADAADGDTIVFNLEAGSKTISLDSELVIDKSLTIDGANTAGSGTPVTVQVTTPGTSAWRVFSINTAGKTINISNMTIKGGSIGTDWGGAMYIISSTVNLTNVIISDSIAAQGGAINIRVGGSLTIVDSTLSGNETNGIGESHGAAIYNHASTVVIESSTFSNNSAHCAGAIFTSTGGGSTTINNSQFTENRGVCGGALYNEPGATTNITNSIIANNSVAGPGGGIQNYGTLNITSSTITGNSATGVLLDHGFGGGILGGGTITIKGSTITGNSAQRKGSGIYISETTSVNESGEATIDGIYVNTGATLIVNNGATLTIADGAGTDDLIVEGALTNSGTINCNEGTVVSYTGGNQNVAPAAYHHLTIAGTNTKTLAGPVTVDGDLTISAGTTLDVSGSNFALNVAGNWSNSGTFTGGTGTVTLDGAGQSITGNTTFHNLTKTVTTADTLTFAAGSTTTVTNTLTLQGVAGQLLSLRSATPDTRWNIDPQDTRSTAYLDVQDSENTNAINIQAGAGSVDSGNNVKWDFPYPVVTTQALTSIATATATGNGNITSLGTPDPTAHGVCWSTTANPTYPGTCDDKGAASATAAFTAGITGLTSGTAYYVRAFATNAAGTSYGGDVTFATLHEAPSLFLPQAGAMVTGTSVTFQWGAVLGATKYHLVVRNKATQHTFKSNETLTGTIVTYADFPGDGTVFEWQVRAGNAWGEWSAWRTFTNGQDTPPPTAIPTLSQWGLIILSVLMLITGAVMYRRREQGLM